MPVKLPCKKTWDAYRRWLRLPPLCDEVVDIRDERHKFAPRTKTKGGK